MMLLLKGSVILLLVASYTTSISGGTQTRWAGINSYYLYSCNNSIQVEALNNIRAAGLKVVRVFLLSTEGEGSIPACQDTPTPDVEPITVGEYNDTILERLDDFLAAASARGIKVTIALHDRWSLGCFRSDAYQKKYNLPVVNCKTDQRDNNPTNFYTNGRKDFMARIEHILTYKSRHVNMPLGMWKDALFSVEPENEAFGDANISEENSDWMCNMSSVIRGKLAKEVLVTTGGGGIGRDVGTPKQFVRAKQLAECPYIDVISLHSYYTPDEISNLITGYATAIQGTGTRLILQEWGAKGVNSTAQAELFTITADIAANHGVPQMHWELQPSNLPHKSTQFGISPPSPAPSPGPQRVRTPDGKGWISQCDDHSCPTEVWVTALYPAAQNAALQPSKDNWPEIWGCERDADCSYNGHCMDGECVCGPAWYGPTCAALRLLPAPKENGYQHENMSSWGGSIVQDQSGTYHMFASQITEGCGLDAWSTNSEIIRATSDSPVGPYQFAEVVVNRFAHEPNVIFTGGSNVSKVMLLGTMYPTPPQGFVNCTKHTKYTRIANTSTKIRDPVPKNTYLWTADTPEGIAKAERQLAIDAKIWDSDPLHNDAICDTNAAAAVVNDGSIVGLWRKCETDHLHTVPHTFKASDGGNGVTYKPNISVNVPYIAHAAAEDPMVYTQIHTTGDNTSTTILHAILHDEQITRCADAPVGCWPGGRHAFSDDGGNTWNYSPFDAYNGTVQYDNGDLEIYYLRARPHMLLDSIGNIIALSNGLRPHKDSEYVFTLVQPVNTDKNV
eukprot:m.64037 g.64037  ORF g.64037 m.64037 type:complete len:788 (+) comp11619_c0_seq3:101-2464(+)